MKNYNYPQSYNALNDEQRRALDMLVYGLDNHINFLITGNAGTGKSFLANAYYEFCRANKLLMLKAAPTGAAAVHIKGVTVHKLLKLRFGVASPVLSEKQIKNAVDVFAEADVIFIDEISMVRCDQLENLLEQVKIANEKRRNRRKTPIQVVICGDFGQLKPIVTQDDARTFEEIYNRRIGNGEAYTANAWNVFNFRTIMLTTQIRQSDAQFCNALESVKLGTTSGLDFINNNTAKSVIKNAIWVCGKKSTADECNRQCLAGLPTKEYVNKASETGFAKVSQTNFVDELRYKVGARVVMVMNDMGHAYVNGTMGTIIDVTETACDNIVKVAFDNGTIANIEPAKADVFEYQVRHGMVQQITIGSVWQYPFKLGYAVTVHKAQGATYEKMNFKPEIFAIGQLYTALSRAKNVDSIYIYGTLTQDHMIPDKDTINFLIELAKKAEDWKQEYAALTGTISKG